MLTCHHCRHEFENHEPAATAICPKCRSEVRVPEPAEWASVVRTASLAEAGYLANELEAGGFESQVQQHDSFSAVDGSWSTLFLIQVPAEQAQQSADYLRSHLADTDLSAPIAAAEEMPERGTVIWRPLALMIVAGATVLLVGHKMRELRVRQQEPPSRARLLTVLEQIDRPFVSVGHGHAPNRFRLVFSRHGQFWRLQEDMDGDGQYDREWRFREPVLEN